MTLDVIKKKLGNDKFELEIFFENVPSFISLGRTANTCRDFSDEYPDKKSLGYVDSDEETKKEDKEEETKSDDEG